MGACASDLFFSTAEAIFVSFQLCDLYGIALAALGMLATLSCGLTIDGFGPISDNAGAGGGCVICFIVLPPFLTIQTSNPCVESAGDRVNP